MISQVSDLKNYSIVILMYATGSSGEFVASALVNSIPGFAKTQEEWISHNRKNFADALGKTLNGGWKHIDNQDVVKRFNWYLEFNRLDNELMHLALSHPDLPSLEFIQQHLNHAPMIEIQTEHTVSMQFKNLSQSKVTYQDYVNGGDNANFGMSYEQYKLQETHSPRPIEYLAPQHLKIEWESLMLSDTARTFDKICQFLNCSGSVEIFKSKVLEYLDRNQDILDQIKN